MARVMQCVRGEHAIQSNAAGAFSGTRMSAPGPFRPFARCPNMSGVEGKAEVRGARSKRRD